MSDTTAIEWTATRLPDGTVLPGYTFNPWIGCTKISPACDNCYAEGWAKRSGLVKWGAHEDRRRTSAANWKNPLKWNREAAATGIRRKVFCASVADVFDNHRSIQPEWRDDLWALIRATPHLDWLLLTKRPGNISRMLPRDWGDGYPNVWLGCTISNQEEADRDIPKLLATPAAIRFISAEPLLGPVDLTNLCDDGYSSVDALREYPAFQAYEDWGDEAEDMGPFSDQPALDWVIVGGESGPHARPMHPDWARFVRDQCQAAGVAFFFKQWGEWLPIPDDRHPIEYTNAAGKAVSCKAKSDGQQFVRVGKKAAGRLLDGREWNEVPG